MRVTFCLLGWLAPVLSLAAQAPPPLPLPPGIATQAVNLAGANTPQESIVTFDPQQVQVGWNNRRWQLVYQGQVLKDFGPNEQDARTAFQLIHELGLTQLGTVGAPHPVMEYWLANGQAPQGLPMGGLRLLPLDTARLRIEQTQGQWCIRDGSRTLFSCGPHHQDAQDALAVIRKYRFDSVGIVGSVTPTMYVFFSRPHAGPGTLSTVSHSSRALAAPHFSRLVKNSDGTPKFERSKGESAAAARGLDGLDRLAPPVVPPLTTPQGPRQRVGALGASPDSPQSATFHWRTQPGFAQQPPATGDRLAFDWRQVSVRQDGGDWKMGGGGLVLANFGPDLMNARLALQALRYYRFSEQHRVGEQPCFIYFAAPPTAPRSVMLGVRAEEFHPDRLEVRRLETGFFTLAEGQRVVFRLGASEEDAKALLEAIKRNRYDRLCRVGEAGGEAMNFLVRSR